MVKVGALWFKKSTKGTAFFSGILDIDKMPKEDKVRVVVFKNDRATAEKAPTHIMYLSEPVGGGGYAGKGKPSQDNFFSGPDQGDGPDDDAPF
jgi:hypothetical protein